MGARMDGVCRADAIAGDVFACGRRRDDRDGAAGCRDDHGVAVECAGGDATRTRQRRLPTPRARSLPASSLLPLHSRSSWLLTGNGGSRGRCWQQALDWRLWSRCRWPGRGDSRPSGPSQWIGAPDPRRQAILELGAPPRVETIGWSRGDRSDRTVQIPTRLANLPPDLRIQGTFASSRLAFADGHVLQTAQSGGGDRVPLTRTNILYRRCFRAAVCCRSGQVR